MKPVTILFLLWCSFLPGLGAQAPQAVLQQYETYREPEITHRRFKHLTLEALIRNLPEAFTVTQAGLSMEGRSIYLVSLGSGPVKVFLWSQMHGDESTATMALTDLFRFFSADDEFNDFRLQLLDRCTFYFLPMLNPDGAERFQRRNALGIDLNRDALRLQTPEARLLKQLRDELDPAWEVNLHDQSRYYATGKEAPEAAAISFLAPAFNPEKELSAKRADAMQLIGWMNRALQEYLPGKIARYDDTFEPRAFGDNIQKWGTRTILIESGGLDGDRDKQELRRMNFFALLTAFDGIATGRFEQVGLDAYQSLPFNDYNAYHDLILREVEIQHLGKWYTVDLAFRQNEMDYNQHRAHYLSGSLMDIGDLSTLYAYQELDARGYQALVGLEFPQRISDEKSLKALDPWQLLTNGYTDVLMAGPMPWKAGYSNLPLKVVGPRAGYQPDAVTIGKNPSLLLRKGDRIEFAVINGRLLDLRVGKDAFLKTHWGK